jgi:hypothetical protein
VIVYDGKTGKPITSIQNWTPPVNPKTQWQKGRSAMELARAWTTIPGGCSAPSDFVALLQGHHVFKEIEIISGAAEDLVPFDKLGEARHADLNLICAGKRGPVTISVEAKADETHGSTVGKANGGCATANRTGQAHECTYAD